MRTCFAIAAVFALALRCANAEIGSIAFYQLVQKSDVIALARVRSLRDKGDDRRIAT